MGGGDDIETETGPALTVIEGGANKPKRRGKKPGRKAARPLTSKQEGFVRAILKGENQSDAYRAAYSVSNMSAHAIWTEAGRLFRHPVISQRILAGRAEMERQTVHSAASLRLHIEKSLFHLSENADTDANRLKALDLLGRTEKVGMFVERTADVTETSTPEEIQAELEKQLAKAFGT